MDVIQQRFDVSFRYPVYFTRDVFARSNAVLRSVLPPGGTSRILFVVDRGVVAAHPHLLEAIDAYIAASAGLMHRAGAVVVIPGGEGAKNDPDVVQIVLHAIQDAALCRHSFVAAIGGGAVLDVVGYAAATAHRGVRLVRIPTTVLAQDDSAVGVKNGINAFGKKNYLGTFAPPWAVINDAAFLPTLEDRDWLGGLSEAVKAALIKDRAFFELLEAHAGRLVARDLASMELMIRRSAELHLAHIASAGDPFELGSSRPLDFGHWAAHKLEQLTRHQLRHGEAVAIGIALDSTYSYLAGSLAEPEWQRILSLLQTLQLSLHVPELDRQLDDPGHHQCVLRGLDEFREHLGGRLAVMLLRAIGEPFDVDEIRPDLMIESVGLLRAFDRAARPGLADDRARAVKRRSN